MGETKRRSPAVFDRTPGEWQPPPQYIPFPEFQEPPPANPVIPLRTRVLSELDVVPLHEGSWPQYQRFPYLDASLFPASPVLPFRYGQMVLLRPEAFVAPRFLPFPYFQEPPAVAAPVIPLRLGQDVLQRDEADPSIHPRFGPFPYFEQPANPVIQLRYGRDVLAGRGHAVGRLEAFVASQHFPYPYFPRAVTTGKGRARIRFIDRALLVRGITFQVPDPLVTAAGLPRVLEGMVAPALPGAFAPQIAFEPFTPIEEPRRVVLHGIVFQIPKPPVVLTEEEKELLLFQGLRIRDD